MAAEITKALGMPFDVLMERLREQAGEVITFYEPEAFVAVGEWHDDFSQTGDDEVRELLAEAHPNEVPANQR